MCSGRMPRKKTWTCPFGTEQHAGGREHVVQSRLAMRRHLTLVRSCELQQVRTAGGDVADVVVQLEGEELRKRQAAYRRSQRLRVTSIRELLSTPQSAALPRLDHLWGTVTAVRRNPFGGFYRAVVCRRSFRSRRCLSVCLYVCLSVTA